jgi:hypothetical protein
MQRAYVFFIMFWESLLFGLQSVHVYTRAAVDLVGVCGASLPHVIQNKHATAPCLNAYNVSMCTCVRCMLFVCAVLCVVFVSVLYVYMRTMFCVG